MKDPRLWILVLRQAAVRRQVFTDWVIKQEAASVDFWMPFTDKLGIYGDSGLVITGTDVSDETGDSGDFGSSEESVDFGSSDSWMSTEGCIVLPEEQAQTIYQNVDSGLPVVIY